MFYDKNNNSCCEPCEPCCTCTPCLPCFNPCGGCCNPSGSRCDPRFCDPRCDPCCSMSSCGPCMLPWIGGRGDACPPDARNVCILPSPQPVCNPESRFPVSVGFPLNPPPPKSRTDASGPAPPVTDTGIPRTQTKSTMTLKKKPRPYIICPYFYPCPYPCSCCSGGTTPYYSPYSIGCPSTCVPCMSTSGMPVNPIPVNLPFGRAPRPFGCIPEICPKKSKKSVVLPTIKSWENFSLNNSCPAKDAAEIGNEEKGVFNLRIDADKIEEFSNKIMNPKCECPPTCCCPKPCSCTRCEPILEWSLCRQRKMRFATKANKFCCGPKICNNVGCFNKPVRNTVAFVSTISTRCYHPFVIQ